MYRLIFATAFAGLLVLPAMAQESDDAAMAEAKTKAAEQIKFADKDGDGTLTLAELRTTRYALRKSLLAAREDKAKTKELSDAAKGLPDFQTFLAADIGNDYKLTADELAKFTLRDSDNKRWRLSDRDVELLAQETGLDKWDWAIGTLDADGDSHLSAKEAALKSDSEKKDFAAADLDKDGLLSSYEFMKFGIDRFKEKSKSKVEKARAEFKDAGGGGPDDPFALYKKEGRTWALKSTSVIEGMDPMVSYLVFKITAVSDKEATQEMSFLDKDKKPMAGMEEGIETRIPFQESKLPPDGAREAPEMKRETIKVEAGEFECYLTEMNDTKTWSSVMYPGLLVKMEGKHTTMELIEFKDGE
jgi:hypothetical protein